jgi:hypothetical protein
MRCIVRLQHVPVLCSFSHMLVGHLVARALMGERSLGYCQGRPKHLTRPPVNGGSGREQDLVGGQHEKQLLHLGYRCWRRVLGMHKSKRAQQFH